MILTNLVPDAHLQRNLVTSDPDKRMVKLSGIMDKLNHKHGLVLYDQLEGYTRGGLTMIYNANCRKGDKSNLLKTISFGF